MNQSGPHREDSVESIGSSELQHAITPDKVWGGATSASTSRRGTSERVAAVLASPIDFPPVTQAVVPGDRVAIVVDPSVPELFDVLAATIETLGTGEDRSYAVIVWHEAPGQLLEELQRRFGNVATIERHQPSERADLRYLAADEKAEPIYCSRGIVDADFVFPITSTRALDPAVQADPTGLFPTLSDSATRRRFTDPASPSAGVSLRMDWLLGVQVMLRVTPDRDAKAVNIVAGTPQSIVDHEALSLTSSAAETGPSRAEATELVVAVLDGDWRQQTWANATRALVAASRHATAGGAIVLWSSLREEPPHGLGMRLDPERDPEHEAFGEVVAPRSNGHETPDQRQFPPFDMAEEIAESLRDVVQEHRILLRSELPQESVEALSLGVIEDVGELRRFASQFKTVGLLPAAQFAGHTIQGRSASSPEPPSHEPR